MDDAMKILSGTGRGTMRSMVEGLRRPSVSPRLPPPRFGEELG